MSQTQITATLMGISILIAWLLKEPIINMFLFLMN